MTQSTVPCPGCKGSEEYFCKLCDGKGFVTTQKYVEIVLDRIASRRKMERQGINLFPMKDTTHRGNHGR